MTRKDFEAAAKIVALFKRQREELGIQFTKDHKDAINTLLRGTNPAFDAIKFWKFVEKV